jgi:hypothetical protein
MFGAKPYFPYTASRLGQLSTGTTVPIMAGQCADLCYEWIEGSIMTAALQRQRVCGCIPELIQRGVTVRYFRNTL